MVLLLQLQVMAYLLAVQSSGNPGEARPIDSPSVLSIALQPSSILVREHSFANRSKHSVVAEFTLPLQTTDGEAEDEIDDALCAPTRRWLAVGGHLPDGKRVLRVVDLRARRQVLRLARSGVGHGRWFTWLADDTLIVVRKQTHGTDGTAYEVEHLAPGGWASSDVSHADERVRQLLSGSETPELRKVRDSSSSLLTRLGYAVPARPAPGGTPATGWRPYMEEESFAATSADGNTIAVYGSLYDLSVHPFGKMAHNDQLVLIRKRTGWREERLPAPREVFQLHFWNGWLVVGDGMLVLEPRSSPGIPRQYRLSSRRFTLYDLSDIRHTAAIAADLLVFVEP